MSSHEVAQSVPAKFYHGTNIMVAPHLPVGSLEREALFKELGRTFSEDWKEAEEAVKREHLEAKGDLYFIRCGDSVKIGHTVNIVNRLAKMQADNHAELDCLLLLKGHGRHEKGWHRRFKHLRIRGEWFRFAPDLEEAISDARAANVARHSTHPGQH